MNVLEMYNIVVKSFSSSLLEVYGEMLEVILQMKWFVNLKLITTFSLLNHLL